MNNNNNTKVFANTRKTRFRLARCDLFHPLFHGITNEFIASQFILDYIIPKNLALNSPENILAIELLHNQKNLYYRSHQLLNNLLFTTTNNIFRNYVEIATNIKNTNYEFVEIFDIIDDGGYKIHWVVKKTFFLRLLQRKWRNYLHRRNTAIQNRMKISSLNYSRIYGRWPVGCYY